MLNLLLNQEISDVQAKCDQLKKTSEMLQNEFNQYVEEAEKKQSLFLISATAMKRKADKKTEDVTKFEKTLGILEQKRKLMK